MPNIRLIPDTKEIADYVLTEAALKKYTQAVRNLQPFMGQLPQECDGDENPKSLNDMAVQMDGVPQVKSALKGARHDVARIPPIVLFCLPKRHGSMGASAAWRYLAARHQNGECLKLLPSA